MKKHLLGLVLVLVATSLMAQKEILPSAVHIDAELNKGNVFGIKGGVNFPRLYYTAGHLAELPHDTILGISGGVFMEFPLFKILAVAPELNYQQRGGGTHYVYEQNHNVKYRLKAGYASLRVPLICYIPVSENFKPYVYIAPDLGCALHGTISLAQDSLDITQSNLPITSANINRFYAGALGGVGFRFDVALKTFTMVIKTDAAINWGLVNTFSLKEREETCTPTNLHAYNIVGERKSRGLEISVSLGFIKKSVDACGYFK